MNEIWHGDSRELSLNLPEPINCVVTDPPYGMAFKSNQAVTEAGKDMSKEIAGDETIQEAIDLFSKVMTNIVPKMAENSDAYVFTKWDLIAPWTEAINNLGLTVRMMLVWEKGGPGIGDLRYNWGCGHEIALYAKKGSRHVNLRRNAVIHTEKVHPGKIIHPTEKPTGLLAEFIKVSTDLGDLVVDPFSGSGSTSVAAQRHGRRSIGIELDPDYYQRSLERLATPSFNFFS